MMVLVPDTSDLFASIKQICSNLRRVNQAEDSSAVGASPCNFRVPPETVREALPATLAAMLLVRAFQPLPESSSIRVLLCRGWIREWARRVGRSPSGTHNSFLRFASHKLRTLKDDDT